MELLNNINKKIQLFAGWRQFEKKVRPEFGFDPSKTPPNPDYGDLRNWVAHPEVVSKVHFTPEGVAANTSYKDGAVDCFFVYPTLYFSKLHWNAPLDHASTNELVEEMIMSGQASAFNDCCRIFAPRYRQATFYSFLGLGGKLNGRRALELAYADVLKAFDHYLDNFNGGRPFFIAGHSQGALHIMRLLEDRVSGTHLVKQLVAAYPIGFCFPMDKFERTLKDLKPSESASSINCIVAWDTYLETGRPLRLLDRAEICYVANGKVQWERRARKEVLGVNPLNWQRAATLVDSKAHLGAVHLHLVSKNKMNWEGIISEETLGLKCQGLSKPYKEQVSAKIGKNGYLYITSPKNKAFKTMVMPKGNLHLFDISLFYMNLRKNVKERWEFFKKIRNGA